MTYKQKRIWIAEKCGWIPDPLSHCWRKPSEGNYAVAFMNGGHAHRQLPDYLNDLNACAEMESTLTHEQLHEMNECLADIMPANEKMWRATALQRCAAFLMALSRMHRRCTASQTK
jgi:hypothetical protein